MNRWLQTKQYTCSKCAASYLHDKAYEHVGFRCPERENVKQQASTTNEPPPKPVVRHGMNQAGLSLGAAVIKTCGRLHFDHVVQ